MPPKKCTATPYSQLPQEEKDRRNARRRALRLERRGTPYARLTQEEKNRLNARRTTLRLEAKQQEAVLISVPIQAEVLRNQSTQVASSSRTTEASTSHTTDVFHYTGESIAAASFNDTGSQTGLPTSTVEDECMLYDIPIGITADECFSTPHTPHQIIPTQPYELPPVPNCRFRGAKTFLYEPPKFCCSGGEVSLYPVNFPAELQELYSGSSAESAHFLQYVKAYNDVFAFTSMGVHVDPEYAKRTAGIYTFRAQGQIYHFIDSLYPAGDMPSYLQLYFYDTDNEIVNRRGNRGNLQPHIIQQLVDILQPNPYSRFFRSLNDLSNIDECQIVLRADPELSDPTTLPPSVSQIAAIWIEDENAEESQERDIIVQKHTGVNQKISHYYGCYDPLQYPLLFPFGEPGWHHGIKKLKAKKMSTSCLGQGKVLPLYSSTAEELLSTEATVREQNAGKRDMVSAREFYAYRFQIRNDTNSILLESSRLLQQFSVDMYAKIETSRLDYFRHKQDEIRADYYQGIVDSIHHGEHDASKIGRRIVLPATFIGGPRNIRRRYLDAMALVEKYGKPDIFLTMTCNPNWKEIKAELKPHEEVQNRPDLVTRVFKSKFEHLQKEVIKKALFGPIAAYTFVVEFQKRGLPHVHMLIILKNAYKLNAPKKIDALISAELPNQQEHPHLYNMVMKHMMHGPCGELNTRNPCMKDSKCKNHFPKSFSPETILEADGYPIYRRRCDGQQVQIRRQILDNRWVVPYNPYLVAMFDCHINVEVCSTVKAIKYLYKYIYKGHDKIIYLLAASNSSDQVDEIKEFQSARWVSPPEAMWRIYRFSLHEMEPAVITLQLHLEGRQMVPFKQNTDLQNIADNEFFTKTMLTQFFATNMCNAKAKSLRLLYKDYPEHFVWNTSQKIWTERKQSHVIGRIVTTNPMEGERYYLRLLLTHVRAPTSYADLRTVHGVMYSSFRQAAVARRLLDDDTSSEQCLEEGSLYRMPMSLRQLFCTVLTYCAPQNPKELFFKFESHMAEDYIRWQKLTKEAAREGLLHALDSELQSMNESLRDFQMDHLLISPPDDHGICKEVAEESNIQISENDLYAVHLLNINQRQAYDEIIDAVFMNKQKCFFVDGPGGTGKTFLYRTLLAKVRSQGKIALATASSGVAASILPNGRIAHSRFKIPIESGKQLNCTVTKQSGLATLLKEAALIIWDEASMANKQSIEALDRLLRDLNDTDILFGGKVVIFGGDFRQVLPVIPKGTRADCVNASFVQSYIWPLLKKFRLTENMRARLDPGFSDYILRIGDGSEKQNKDGLITLQRGLVLEQKSTTPMLEQLINFVFPSLQLGNIGSDSFTASAILTPKNNAVDEINEVIMGNLPGEEYEYLSFDEAKDPNQQGLYIDFMNSISNPGLPLHHLILKEGSPIILLRNINPSKGLCNGTRLICKEFKPHLIVAQISVGERKGTFVFIPRIPLQQSESQQYPVDFTRRQFPVRTCVAMTINKAQGQTLDIVGIYLPEPVFTHGQLYVAFSRATTSEKLRVYLKHAEKSLMPSYDTKNIVYNEIFARASYS